MTQPPLLIRELERIARERGWSTAQLAEQLGLSEKSFYNLRIGINTVSMGTLSHIDSVFGRDPTIHGLIHHFLMREYPALGRQRTGARPTDLPANIPYKPRWRLLAWLKAIPANESPRRSLFVVSSDTATLASTARFVADAARVASLGVMLMRGDQRLTPTEIANAVDVDLLIVERIDHAKPNVLDIINRRSDGFQPMLLTSAVDRDDLVDTRLVRLVCASAAVLRLAQRSRRPTPATPHVSS